MTYARRTDANAKDIVKRLRELGVQVFDMQRAAGTIPGFPDLLVNVVGTMHLIEVKTINGSFTDDQTEFHQEWRGPPIYTIRSPEEAECWVIRMRAKRFQ